MGLGTIIAERTGVRRTLIFFVWAIVFVVIFAYAGLLFNLFIGASSDPPSAPGNLRVSDEISPEHAFLYKYWSKEANKLRVINEMKQESEVVDAAIWTCTDDDYPYVEEMDCLEIHIVIIVNDGTAMGRARELGQQFVETAGKEFQRDLAFFVFVQENSDKKSLTYGTQCQSCSDITWRD